MLYEVWSESRALSLKYFLNLGIVFCIYQMDEPQLWHNRFEWLTEF